jgi:hypothetical protein
VIVHTTPGIPEFMEPEVALLTAGVEYDVLGIGYHDVSDADRAEITALHPRPDFKRSILRAFTEGIAPKPEPRLATSKPTSSSASSRATSAATLWTSSRTRTGRSKYPASRNVCRKPAASGVAGPPDIGLPSAS